MGKKWTALIFEAWLGFLFIQQTLVKHSHRILAIVWVSFVQTVFCFWYFTLKFTETIRTLLSLCHITRTGYLGQTWFIFGDTYKQELKPHKRINPGENNGCSKPRQVRLFNSVFRSPSTYEQLAEPVENPKFGNVWVFVQVILPLGQRRLKISSGN